MPTGLPTTPVGVAVPHADPDHVRTPAVAVGRAVTPIAFAEMASPERTVEVRLVFLLALSSKQQAAMLSALVTAFQREGFLGSMLAADTALDVTSIVQSAVAADAAALAVADS
jgi:PTS system galactitol-specific IIA component